MLHIYTLRIMHVKTPAQEWVCHITGMPQSFKRVSEILEVVCQWKISFFFSFLLETHSF